MWLAILLDLARLLEIILPKALGLTVLGPTAIVCIPRQYRAETVDTNLLYYVGYEATVFYLYAFYIFATFAATSPSGHRKLKLMAYAVKPLLSHFHDVRTAFLVPFVIWKTLNKSITTQFDI